MPTNPKVMTITVIGFSSVKAAAERNTVAVTREEASSAGTRNDSPSSNPIAPTAPKANNVLSFYALSINEHPLYLLGEMGEPCSVSMR
jgi:hypothetical protein